MAALGVEHFLSRRAVANGKPVNGLESLREGEELFTGLGDRESEALLLLTFINAASAHGEGEAMIKAWRRGDADDLARQLRSAYRDVPSYIDRIVISRNRNWLPKLETYLHSGRTYFLVVGSRAHGRGRWIARAPQRSGYRLEQL